MSGVHVLVDAQGCRGEYGVGVMTVFSPAGQDGIFIGYRTDDGSFAADRLHGRLAHHFSNRQIFWARGLPIGG